MKKINKPISVILALLMTFMVAVPVFAVPEDADNDLPIVTIGGRTDTLYNKVTREKVYPVVEDEIQYTKDCAAVIAKAFAQAVAEEQIRGEDAWDDYCDLVYDKVSYMFNTIQLDENGEPKDDTGVLWDADSAYVSPKKSNYNVGEYTFYYDWRLDPLELAEQLDIYIGRVLAATGKSKVRLFVHCLGGTILSAYIADPDNKFKYNDKIEGIVTSVPTNDSSATVGALYSGKIYFDSDALDNYCTYYLSSDRSGSFFDENPELLAFAVAMVSMLNQAKVLGLGTKVMNDIYAKLKENLVPRLVRSCFFFPSYWAMIGEDYWDDAIGFIFKDGFEKQYSVYLDKINKYHNEVQVNIKSDLKKLNESGVKISNIVKYGFNLLPVFEGCKTLGDGRMEVSSLSWGATTADMNTQLSNAYIEAAKANGTDKYISGDLKIDASTCLFPDSTWFIRNMFHGGTPSCVTTMAKKLFTCGKQPTVWDFEEYPQYMHYNDENGQLTKIVEDDYPLDKHWTNNIFQAFFRFLKSMIDLLVKLFSKKS